MGDDNSILELENILQKESILGLFCEFPSNPLLKCSNMKRIRDLADKYGFPIVIDDTLGNFFNIDALSYADIIVSSLTKVFSGDSNVMGGRLDLILMIFLKLFL